MSFRVSKTVFGATAFAVAVAASAVAQSPQPLPIVPANADVKDREIVLPKNSQLRTGPSLFNRPVAIAPATITVRGNGRCDEGACPVIYDGKSVWARRSRLLFGTAEQAAVAPPTPKPGVVERVKGAITAKKEGSTGPAVEMPRRLERGNQGPAVVRLQEALKKEGVFSGEVDGNFGRGTRAAVIEFQKAKRIQADGIAGRETFRLLGLI
jgi:hypothetical protein